MKPLQRPRYLFFLFFSFLISHMTHLIFFQFSSVTPSNLLGQSQFVSSGLSPFDQLLSSFVVLTATCDSFSSHLPRLENTHFTSTTFGLGWDRQCHCYWLPFSWYMWSSHLFSTPTNQETIKSNRMQGLLSQHCPNRHHFKSLVLVFTC